MAVQRIELGHDGVQWSDEVRHADTILAPIQADGRVIVEKTLREVRDSDHEPMLDSNTRA